MPSPAAIPVIPLIAAMKCGARRPGIARPIHRGATSQDILDSAVMLVARRASDEVVEHLRRTEAALSAFALEHRDQVAAARTLTQHAVPTTVGLRAANWLRGVSARAGAARRGSRLAAGAARRCRGHAGRPRPDRARTPGQRRPRGRRRLPAAFAAELGARRARGAVAHESLAGHRTRRRARAGDRRRRRARGGCRDALAHRDRRALRGQRRRILGHAAEAEPDGIRPHPLGRDPRTLPRRDPARGFGVRRRRAPGRRLACGVADAASSSAARARRDRHRRAPRRGPARR